MRQPNLLRLEHVVGLVLRIGVAVSTICLALGLVLSLSGVDAAPLFLQIGILVLLATPVARVCVSIGEYLVERDWLFAALTFIVLAELASGALAAFYGRKL
jgi:uncharacterized membrane protein